MQLKIKNKANQSLTVTVRNKEITDASVNSYNNIYNYNDDQKKKLQTLLKNSYLANGHSKIIIFEENLKLTFGNEVNLSNSILNHSISFEKEDFKKFVLSFVDLFELENNYIIFDYKNKYNYIKYAVAPYSDKSAFIVTINNQGIIEKLYGEFFSFRDTMNSLPKILDKNSVFEGDLIYTNLGKFSKSNKKEDIVLVEGNTNSLYIKKSDLYKIVNKLKAWYY